MNRVLINWSPDQNSHVRLSLEALKSSKENVTVGFFLSVLPSVYFSKVYILTTKALEKPEYWHTLFSIPVVCKQGALTR